jgi:hypothetical protein
MTVVSVIRFLRSSSFQPSAREGNNETFSIVEAVPKAHRDILVRLQKECLREADVWQIDGSFWWLVRDENNGPIGFAGLHVSDRDHGIGILCRAGVVEEARGHGLHGVSFWRARRSPGRSSCAV